MGIYTGSPLHEVAHVVGAGDAMGNGISDSAIIVKMIRVMMLVPVLLITTYLVARARKKQVQKGKKFQKIAIPVSYTHLDVYKRQAPGLIVPPLSS